MKWSEVSLEELLSKSNKEKWQLVCGDIRDGGECGEVALLLGTSPDDAELRAHAAAKLYLSGRVKYVVSSGGVHWEHNGEKLTEAELMSRVMQADGVPADAIILDNLARTTQENMICGTLAINRTVRVKNVKRVIIVTNVTHMQRSLALAKAFLPRKFAVSSYPSYFDVGAEEWIADEENVATLDKYIRLTKALVDDSIVEDMEM